MNTYIDFYKVNELELNDFDRFDKILFTEEELTMKPEKRWKKYYNFSPDKKLIVYAPFNPSTIIEYQLCHYIMWSCIGYSKSDRKPYIRDFNSKEYLFNTPIHCCYACAWDINIKWENKEKGDSFQYYRCKYCPIWVNSLDGVPYQCEENNSYVLEENKNCSDYVIWKDLYYIQPIYAGVGYIEDDEDIILQNERIGEKLKELALKIARYTWTDKT